MKALHCFIGLSVIGALMALGEAVDVWRHYSGAEPLTVPRLLLRISLVVFFLGFTVFYLRKAAAESQREK